MNDRKSLVVGEDGAGKRLDIWLTQTLGGLSRSRIQQLIREGAVRVDSRSCKESHRVRIGEQVEVVIPPPRPAGIRAEKIPLRILFEDEALLVIDKPAGLVVHPAPGHASGTLVNAILHHCPGLAGIGGELRPGIVHRLDQDTSGVILVAKTAAALASLAGQFKRREISKEYLAIVSGALSPAGGRIRTMIGRHATDRKKMTALPRKGRPAVTGYETLEKLGAFSLVRLKPETGRTHQLRVHLAHVGHPIIGDRQYGGKKVGRGVPALTCGEHSRTSEAEGPAEPFERTAHPEGSPYLENNCRLRQSDLNVLEVKRQMLHAHKISFHHPATGQKMEFEAPLPEDMERVLDYLRQADRSQRSEVRGQRSDFLISDR